MDFDSIPNNLCSVIVNVFLNLFLCKNQRPPNVGFGKFLELLEKSLVKIISNLSFIPVN